jgi:hypothetical protein
VDLAVLDDNFQAALRRLDQVALIERVSIPNQNIGKRACFDKAQRSVVSARRFENESSCALVDVAISEPERCCTNFSNK